MNEVNEVNKLLKTQLTEKLLQLFLGMNNVNKAYKGQNFQLWKNVVLEFCVNDVNKVNKLLKNSTY